METDVVVPLLECDSDNEALSEEVDNQASELAEAGLSPPPTPAVTNATNAAAETRTASTVSKREALRNIGRGGR